jgi:hypothetical protein
MAAAARALGRPEAASVIAEDLLALAGITHKHSGGPSSAFKPDLGGPIQTQGAGACAGSCHDRSVTEDQISIGKETATHESHRRGRAPAVFQVARIAKAFGRPGATKGQA